MKNNIFAASVLALFLVTGIPSAASAAQTVAVTLPTFPVTLNGCQIPPAYDKYPVIVYKDITYFPMTYHYGDFLGLTTNWSNNTLTVNKKNIASSKLLRYEQMKKNKNKQMASIATSNIIVNGEIIHNNQEKYPLLLFRDVTYFPLTWRFAVEEFGWKYTFDMEHGLQIDSNFLGTEQTIALGKITIGFPQNTWNEKYGFVYQNGEIKKTFSLETYLQDGIYYLNQQADKNGYVQPSQNAKIENNILFLPCVRQNNNTKENVLLEINLTKGAVINKINLT